MHHNNLFTLLHNLKFKYLINILAFISLYFSSNIFALPDVNQVINGNVAVAIEGNALQINQTSDKAIINWNSFNITTQESVHFQQPTNGICLNRVDATNAMSQINGNLNATGKILLINQAGILFGENAQVNIGGIVASTADIADQNFLNDKFIFDQCSILNGAIINRGTILTANEGLVAFLGASAVDNGVIQAKMGNVILASGKHFTLNFNGNEIIDFAINMPTAVSGMDEHGNKLLNGIDVSGQIYVDDGAVLLSGKALDEVFDNLINTSGLIHAEQILIGSGNPFITAEDIANGKIVLTGQLMNSVQDINNNSGAIWIDGEQIIISGDATINATTENKGGNISIAGKQITINDNSILNASGDIEGGLITLVSEKIIIDNNTLLNAKGKIGKGLIVIGQQSDINDPDQTIVTQNIYIGPSVKINVDAIENGNGGCIVASADFDTDFLGYASARGGSISGNGGKIGIHSRGSLADINSTKSKIDVGATNGTQGNITINNGPAIDINEEFLAKVPIEIDYKVEFTDLAKLED